MPDLEFKDMQGFIARGYGSLPAAAYLVLTVDEGSEARAWLKGLIPSVTPADLRPETQALHVAFTSHGLRALGLDETSLRSFSREFWEGMADDHRARHVLGDRGASAPGRWRWGGDTHTHALLLLFARDNDELGAFVNEVRAAYGGVRELAWLDTFAFDSPLEHFGFNDGIAQPFMEGLRRTGPPANTVAAGEFVLGYPNEYGRRPLTPLVESDLDPAGVLPSRVRADGSEPKRDGPSFHDLGKNGTYLVFRELSQDVPAFWRFVDEASRLDDGSSNPEERLRLAAKMVGRWPSGAPLTLCPDQDDPDQGSRDDFGYREHDRTGDRCPLGAHIRRTNPRDALEGSPEDALKVANRHRLLRRGRPYGAPISRTMDIEEILRHTGEHEEVGLHFISLGTDIARQFEFVQHTWINNAKFDGLYTDADPLMGHTGDRQGTFTLQGAPVRTRVTGMERFVETRGGGYFFLPGVRALRYLASLPAPPTGPSS